MVVYRVNRRSRWFVHHTRLTRMNNFDRCKRRLWRWYRIHSDTHQGVRPSPPSLAYIVSSIAPLHNVSVATYRRSRAKAELQSPYCSTSIISGTVAEPCAASSRTASWFASASPSRSPLSACMTSGVWRCISLFCRSTLTSCRIHHTVSEAPLLRSISHAEVLDRDVGRTREDPLT